MRNMTIEAEVDDLTITAKISDSFGVTILIDDDIAFTGQADNAQSARHMIAEYMRELLNEQLTGAQACGVILGRLASLRETVI